MKFRETQLSASNESNTVGFVEIESFGKAQQVMVNPTLLKGVLRMTEALEKLGFDKIYLTVENSLPLVIGGKNSGVAIAPRLEE